MSDLKLREAFGEALTKYPTLFKYENGMFELYVDNHTLSTLRTCEAMFQESILNSLKRKTQGGRIWYFDFGIWFHTSLEIFYNAIIAGKPLTCPEWVEQSTMLWAKMKMNDFGTINDGKPHKVFKDLGGITGAVGILVNYHMRFGNGLEPFKFIGTELSFGFAREVLLGTVPFADTKVFVYYCGRMDAVIDDGIFICPLDHKTTNKFRGNEADHFKPHEGIAGYVYSLGKIYGKPCNKAYINHVSVSTCENYLERFKRSPISFTPAELEEWRLRQISTAKRLIDIAVLRQAATWNTGACSNFSSACAYKTLHANDPVHRDMIVSADFVKVEPWNPYKIEGNREEAGE